MVLQEVEGMEICLLLIGEPYKRFVRKRALVKYQSQSEVIKVIVYLVSHLTKPLNFENSNSFNR